jgi:hypothetical protein
MAQNKNQGNQGNQGSEEKGSMTVQEAGRMGGERVRELVNEGKQVEGEQTESSEQESGGSKKSR